MNPVLICFIKVRSTFRSSPTVVQNFLMHSLVRNFVIGIGLNATSANWSRSWLQDAQDAQCGGKEHVRGRLPDRRASHQLDNTMMGGREAFPRVPLEVTVRLLQPTSRTTLNNVFSLCERSTSLAKKEASAEECAVQSKTIPGIVILYHTSVQDGDLPPGFEREFMTLSSIITSAAARGARAIARSVL